jgi:hypothetical protein
MIIQTLSVVVLEESVMMKMSEDEDRRRRIMRTSEDDDDDVTTQKIPTGWPNLSALLVNTTQTVLMAVPTLFVALPQDCACLS